MSVDAVKRAFARMYGREAQGVVRAPGRVNLIGEHTDYNDGFVLPIAIERHTLAAWAKRDERGVHFASTASEAGASVDLDGEITPGEPAWANYCKGVAAGLVAAGQALCGCEILFDTTVPLGGGLSSSASLTVSTAWALLAAAGGLGRAADGDLAEICRTAEHRFAGAPVGIMDQSIAIMGREGRALLLDCRSGKARQIPFDDPDRALLVVDTQVKHDIADGGYAARRDQCYSAAKKLGVAMLRDADEPILTGAMSAGALNETESRRARHVIGEIARTLDGVAALEADDYRRFGQRMYESHASLRDDYEISCEELDEVVALAERCPGVYGARMTGGGFGGCAIILVQTAQAEAVAKTVRSGFEARFAQTCPIFATRAAAGASVLE